MQKINPDNKKVEIENKIQCIHTAVMDMSVKDFSELENDIDAQKDLFKKILNIHSSEELQDINLSSEEKFMALKSWVAGIAEADLDAFRIQGDTEQEGNLMARISSRLLNFMIKIDSNFLPDLLLKIERECKMDNNWHESSLIANLIPIFNLINTYYITNPLYSINNPADLKKNKKEIGDIIKKNIKSIKVKNKEIIRLILELDIPFSILKKNVQFLRLLYIYSPEYIEEQFDTINNSLINSQGIRNDEKFTEIFSELMDFLVIEKFNESNNNSIYGYRTNIYNDFSYLEGFEEIVRSFAYLNPPLKFFDSDEIFEQILHLPCLEKFDKEIYERNKDYNEKLLAEAKKISPFNWNEDEIEKNREEYNKFVSDYKLIMNKDRVDDFTDQLLKKFGSKVVTEIQKEINDFKKKNRYKVDNLGYIPFVEYFDMANKITVKDSDWTYDDHSWVNVKKGIFKDYIEKVVEYWKIQRKYGFFDEVLIYKEDYLDTFGWGKDLYIEYDELVALYDLLLHLKNVGGLSGGDIIISNSTKSSVIYNKWPDNFDISIRIGEGHVLGIVILEKNFSNSVFNNPLPPSFRNFRNLECVIFGFTLSMDGPPPFFDYFKRRDCHISSIGMTSNTFRFKNNNEEIKPFSIPEIDEMKSLIYEKKEYFVRNNEMNSRVIEKGISFGNFMTLAFKYGWVFNKYTILRFMDYCDEILVKNGKPLDLKKKWFERDEFLTERLLRSDNIFWDHSRLKLLDEKPVQRIIDYFIQFNNEERTIESIQKYFDKNNDLLDAETIREAVEDCINAHVLELFRKQGREKYYKLNFIRDFYLYYQK